MRGSKGVKRILAFLLAIIRAIELKSWKLPVKTKTKKFTWQGLPIIDEANNGKARKENASKDSPDVISWKKLAAFLSIFGNLGKFPTVEVSFLGAVCGRSAVLANGFRSSSSITTSMRSHSEMFEESCACLPAAPFAMPFLETMS
jgi:hypothetical protein